MRMVRSVATTSGGSPSYMDTRPTNSGVLVAVGTALSGGPPQLGRVEARTGLRMMPTFPRPPLSFRTAGFPRYGWKAGISDSAFPRPHMVKPAPGMPMQEYGLRRAAAILSRVRSEMISRSNWAKLRSMFKVKRPIELVEQICCVTETNATLCTSNFSMMRAKSSNDRLKRSTLYTTTQSTLRASISDNSRLSAGRSMFPPVKPPSS